MTVYALFAAPIVALAALVAQTRAGRMPNPRAAQLVAAVVMVAALDTFILRDPVSARVGGMAGPVAVLLGWLASLVPGRTGLSWAARVGSAVIVGALTLPLPVIAEWDRRLTWGTFGQPIIAGKIRRLSTPSWASINVVDTHTAVFVRYLHACTHESDRVLAGWYFPELYFFGQRGFAGGLPVVFGSHWSEDRFERQSVARLAAERPPVVFVQGDQFPSDYEAVAAFLDTNYRLAGTTDFGDGAGGRRYTVLVPRDRPASGTDRRWGLPCFK